MTAKIIPILIPKENPNDDEVTLIDCLIPSGSEVREGVEIALLETIKTTFQVISPASGFLFFRYKKGDQIPVGQVLAYVADTTNFEWKTYEDKKEVKVDGSAEKQTITRKARKLLEEHGIDSHIFSGLEVVKEEQVLEWIQRNRPIHQKNAPTQVSSLFLSQKLSATKNYEVECLESVYRTIIPSKVDKKISYPLLQEKIDQHSQNGLIITLGDLFVYSTTRILRDFPDLNAFYQDKSICRYQEINVGYAMNLDNKGLKVPVIQHADTLSLREIAVSIKELSLKYLRNELTPADVLGGTFTITDLSSMRVASFSPVLNLNQSAILGLASPDPSGNFLMVTLAFDHRLTDGMSVAYFLNALEECLLSKSLS